MSEYVHIKYSHVCVCVLGCVLGGGECMCTLHVYYPWCIMHQCDVWYLFVAISKLQSLPRHLCKILLPRLLVSVGTHKHNVKLIAIGALLKLLVPLRQLRSKRPANLENYRRTGPQII